MASGVGMGVDAEVRRVVSCVVRWEISSALYVARSGRRGWNLVVVIPLKGFLLGFSL